MRARGVPPPARASPSKVAMQVAESGSYFDALPHDLVFHILIEILGPGCGPTVRATCESWRVVASPPAYGGEGRGIEERDVVASIALLQWFRTLPTQPSCPFTREHLCCTAARNGCPGSKLNCRPTECHSILKAWQLASHACPLLRITPWKRLLPSSASSSSESCTDQL